MTGATPAGGRVTEPARGVPSARAVVFPAALGAGTLLALATQTWARGTSTDVLVAGSAVAATGSTLVPLGGSLALAAAAAAVVSLTGGRVVRLLGAVLLLVLGVATLAALGWFLADPGTPLAADLAARTGRTTSPEVSAHATWPAWAALVAAALLPLSGVAALRRAGHRGGLSRRYDSPVSDATAAGASRPESLWDRVTRGEADDERPPTHT